VGYALVRMRASENIPSSQINIFLNVHLVWEIGNVYFVDFVIFISNDNTRFTIIMLDCFNLFQREWILDRSIEIDLIALWRSQSAFRKNRLIDHEGLHALILPYCPMWPMTDKNSKVSMMSKNPRLDYNLFPDRSKIIPGWPCEKIRSYSFLKQKCNWWFGISMGIRF
jgi:hypothetical protein